MVSEEQQLRLWMVQAQDGDSSAYRSLLDALARLCRGFVAKRLIQKNDVEDVVQEILMAIHSARASYLPEKPFLPWFYAIARYRMIDSMRKLGKTARREQVVEELPDVAAPEAEDHSLSEDLEAALFALPEKQRQVVELMKISGLSVEETARKTGMSPSAVKVTAHRAYEALRRALGGKRA